MEKKKILILGGTGFVGRHLLEELKNLNQYEITCMVRKPVAKPLPGSLAETILGDISNEQDVLKASKGMDVIINLAAPNTQNLEINRKILVKGAENIINAAKKNNIPKVVALSSIAGYRKNLDNYGRAKKEADEVYKTSNLNLTILRPTMIYGKGGYAFEKLLASVTKIPFLTFAVGNGQNKIQPAFIGDTVNAIIASIEHDSPIHTNSPTPEIFDLGGPVPIKYDDFVKLIQAKLKKRKLIIHIPLALLVGLAKILKIFIRNASWNDLTFKRMVEEIDLDTGKTEKELGIRFTDYETALESLKEL